MTGADWTELMCAECERPVMLCECDPETEENVPMTFRIGDLVRCDAVYGAFNTGRVSQLPRPDDPFYRVEVGEVIDEDGELDAGCYFNATEAELVLVQARDVTVTVRL